ncbi:putative F-box associated interaction domain-containing protein [Helianthus annuus]|uniref:F-box associated interaction domain-containing protein n=1 Tax=Helianthus annuus TaxID=4232 RepID=A0A251UMH4_HELAN|nr:putative F-box/kelch-repeat protein At3g17280 [Helianthus annuus]KAF5805851.1 putative F-box associated interaction domain-containing protein [Helianthus annuus]KAJ0576978.1 putative F-box associated interaction domain-containing protein [Helianthus annuus]KAJ0584545.1 putative F-box associated interaction domain-containing protein [Helianthus annuus]KAJ0750208.1 putative F-box associated interaction domain-containing protein [Helianthus annuus]KAJ0918928.1 putative F-box associated interac
MEKIGMEMVVDEIFSRLPTKAVDRFKSLSKYFRKELPTHNFELKHSRRAGNSLQKKLLSLKHESIVVDDIVGGNLEVDTSKTITFPYNIHPSFLRIISSFNGLLLVCNERIFCELILWNPITGRFKLISDDYFNHRFDRNSDTGGMYFDQFDDLKVLHIKCYRNVATARVYSRRLDSWRKINFLNESKFASSSYSWSPATYSGKTIYFMVSNYWFLPGERNIVTFDVISESFSVLCFPERMEVNPCQGHFLTILNKLHVIVVGRADELIADLFKLEHDDWVKVFSFDKPHILDYQGRQQRTNIIQDNKLLITSIWGDFVEVDLCNEAFNYLQHVDNYNGPKGALFIETTVSPIESKL